MPHSQLTHHNMCFHNTIQCGISVSRLDQSQGWSIEYTSSMIIYNIYDMQLKYIEDRNCIMYGLVSQ